MTLANLIPSIIFICATVPALCQDLRTAYFPKKASYPDQLPPKEKVWIFVLAGQSNMAGRGIVEPQDTIPHNRILSIDSSNNIVHAKEPLHFYEPVRTGLDCGLSFGRELLKHIPPDVSILLIPAAVGGSSTTQWLGDSLYRGVKLMSNFRERVEKAKQQGTVKAILWHQGESDSSPRWIPGYDQRLAALFTRMRKITGNDSLPVLIGELGSFSNDHENWSKINDAIHKYATMDHHAHVIKTKDFTPMTDKIHFDAASQRLMGKRMAEAFSKQMGK